MNNIGNLFNKTVKITLYKGLKLIATSTYQINSKIEDILQFNVDELAIKIEKSTLNLSNAITKDYNRNFSFLTLTRKKFFIDSLYAALINTIFFNKQDIINLNPLYHFKIES